MQTMTIKIEIETLYTILDKIDNCINLIKKAKAGDENRNQLTGLAIGMAKILGELEIIDKKQMIYIESCIKNAIQIDTDILGNFPTFK